MTSYREDFDNAVNEQWKKENPIPDIYPRYTNFTAMHEELEKLKIEMCKDMSNALPFHLFSLYTQPTSSTEMDYVKHEKLHPILNTLDKTELVQYLLSRIQYGDYTLLHISHGGTERNPLFQIPNFSLHGLSVLDKTNYEEEKGHREPFLAMVRKQCEEFGLDQEFMDCIDRIWDLEKQLSTYHYSKAERREPLKTYHPTTIHAVREKMAPYFDNIAESLPNDYHDITLNNHHILDGMRELYENATLNELKTYMAWRVIKHYAPYMNNQVYNNHFDFYQTHMNGTKSPKNIEKRAANVIEGMIEDMFTKMYLEQHAEVGLADEMNDFVGRIRGALREKMVKAQWMCEKTREKALDKLDSMNVKVVGPPKYRDYTALDKKYEHFLEFVDVYYEWDWNEIEVNERMYKLRDPDTWLMSSMTINAYYHPLYNEIVFPAGILQAPFFSTQQTFAENAGGIGAVIAHEITHGFDDQGSRFDKNGYLYTWWSQETRERYETIIQAMEDHFNSLVHEDLSMNGKLTQGENLADLGGLQTAIYACKTKEEKRDCMLSWAKIWRANVRREYAQQMIELDPHSPPRLRINAILQHIDDFYSIFDVVEGDAMYLDQERRCTLWNEQ